MAFKGLTLNTPPEMAAHILAEDDAAIYEALLGDDRVLDIGNKLAATVITNNSVRISDGVAVVGGHVGRIKKGDYQDMTIENGVSGKKRNDLICARFITNGDTDTYNLVVVKGAAGTTATDPSVVKGNLYAGDKQRDFPLWRVCLDGLSITKVQQMFSVSKTNKYFSDQLDQLNRNSQIVDVSSEFTLLNNATGSISCYTKAGQLHMSGDINFPDKYNTDAAFLILIVPEKYRPRMGFRFFEGHRGVSDMTGVSCRGSINNTNGYVQAYCPAGSSGAFRFSVSYDYK